MAWLIDDIHTHVGFSVKHLMVSTVRGQFKQYRGTLDLDPVNFTRSRFEGEIDVGSVDTGNEQRDQHLRTGDFFDVANHPKIVFKSTRIEAKDDGEFTVHGDLTMRGVTRPIALDVEFHGVGKNFQGKPVAGLTARGTLNRKEFGVSFDKVVEGGGLALGDKVKIEIEAELVGAEATAQAASERATAAAS